MTKILFTTLCTFGVFIIGSLIEAEPVAAQSDEPAAQPNSSQTVNHDQEQQAKADAIMRRVHAGDWSAMEDAAAQLDRSASRQLLSDLLMSHAREDEPFRLAVGRTLSKMGLETDFSDQIVRATRNIVQPSPGYFTGLRDRDKAFRALQYMHSKRSVAVLASFLFDESSPAPVEADVIECSNSVMAAAALARLGFVDAPTTEHASFNPGSIEKWKKWWIEHKVQFGRE